jgi:hypothetical protein
MYILDHASTPAMKRFLLGLLCLITVSGITMAQVPVPAYTGTAYEPSGQIN